MKKFIYLCVVFFTALSADAQTLLDHFTIGPYIVDYLGNGKVKYRLKDMVDLYDFFELKRDTTIIQVNSIVAPVKHAVEISGKVGANRFAAKELGLKAVWKQNIGKNLYFNGGLSFVIDHSNFNEFAKRNMLEIGVPLQIELGALNHERASLFGSFGVIPAFYSTMSTKVWENDQWEDGANKKSGFLVAPSLEFGGNIPVGIKILRIGVYCTYKINCTTGEYDVYKKESGHFFLGAKIGIVL